MATADSVRRLGQAQPNNYLTVSIAKVDRQAEPDLLESRRSLTISAKRRDLFMPSVHSVRRSLTCFVAVRVGRDRMGEGRFAPECRHPGNARHR